MRRLDRILVGIVLVLLLFSFQLRHQSLPAPPDVVDAAIPRTSSIVARADGELVTYPDAEVTLGAACSGKVVWLDAHEDAPVHRGELLAELDSGEQRAELEEARAQAAAAQVDVDYLSAEVERLKRLAAAKAISPDAFQRVQRDQQKALAKRSLAQASINRLKAVLANTRVISPIDGIVVNTYARLGEIIAAGAPMIKVANPRRVRVEAEVAESAAGLVHPGMPALISAEGFPGRSWRGVVQEVPAELVARHLEPQDSVRPIESLVLMVKIALKQPIPVKLNQRVEVTLIDPDERYATAPSKPPDPRKR